MSLVSNQINPVLAEGTKDIQAIMADFEARLASQMEAGKVDLQALLTSAQTELDALMGVARVDLGRIINDAIATAAGYEVVLAIRPKSV